MLYLTRGTQEAIRIGDDITVVVLKVKGDQVTLGIEAPKEVAVMREEAVRGASEPAPALEPSSSH